jgi:monofunctional biosynthetic peptidoglycan transglycosylase
VVDGVMGGRSTGRVARNEPGVLEFSGDLSLENNGGFSQMRCDVSGDQFAGMRGIEITVRGDGRKYNFDVRCANARVMAGGFQRAFATRDGEWTTIRMPFDDFRLYSFGRRIPGAPSIVPTSIESIGVTLSDKTEGPFRLDVASIRTFGDATDPGGATDSSIATLSRRSTLQRLLGLIEADEPERTPQAASATVSAKAVRLTELAINRGAPLFNDGQPAACAAIYEVTIEALVALGADDLGRSVVERLEKGLADAKTDANPSARAWTLRRTLDDAYGHLARQLDRGRRAAAR